MLDKETNTLYFTEDAYFGALKLKASGKKLKVAVRILSAQLNDRFYDQHTPFAAATIGDTEYTVEVLSRNGSHYGSPSSYYYAIGKRLYNNIDNAPSQTSIILTALDVDKVSPSYSIEYDTAVDAKKAELAFRQILEANSFAIIDSKTKIKLSSPPDRFVDIDVEEIKTEEEEVTKEKKPAGIFNRSMLKGIKR